MPETLHVINMSEIISDDLVKSLEIYRVCGGYKIWEDALVYFWNNYTTVTWGAYAG